MEQLMNKWFEFYKNRINNFSYEEYFKKRYSPYLAYLNDNIRPNMKLGEFGCGTSLVTKLIWNKHCKFTVTDNNLQMLELTSTNLKNFKVKKCLIDIQKPIKDKFDLIYSHGVLEHFDPNNIDIIISNQLKICSHLVHYVPTIKYEKPSFGDERLWSHKYWLNRFKPTQSIHFNNDYDLILIWRRK